MLLQRYQYKLLKSKVLPFLIGLGFIYIYCEYLIYYVVQIQCEWPTLRNPDEATQPVRALVIADPHLLGSVQGHWMDKWRREWQMHRAFQTAISLHSPEVVFVLGDLFDEGKWSSEKEFNRYVNRFHEVFKLPEGIEMYAIVGNHDIGFHYRITPHLVRRFENKMKSPPVQLVSIRGNHFVLINSMAMEGDGCSLCSRAVAELENIADIFKCSSGSSLCKGQKKLEQFSRPIIMQENNVATTGEKTRHKRETEEDYMKVCKELISDSSFILFSMQQCVHDPTKYFAVDDSLPASTDTHFPLFRESDSICTEPDAAPLPERNDIFEERWHCLSKESTEYLVETLYPRAAIGGHTHHSCVVRHSFVPTADHKIEFVEYTVPSFSWRNRINPKYYLFTVTPHEVKVSKCGMPQETTLMWTAAILFVALVVYVKYFYNSSLLFNKWSRKKSWNYTLKD